jgi:hypothetical protein
MTTRGLTTITMANQPPELADSPLSGWHLIVSEIFKGIRRAIGTNQVAKAPLLTGDIRRLVGHSASNLLGLHDGGLILVGFAGALRRSEIATVNIKGVSFTKHGSRNFPEIARQQ